MPTLVASLRNLKRAFTKRFHLSLSHVYAALFVINLPRARHLERHLYSVNARAAERAFYSVNVNNLVSDAFQTDPESASNYY
jgi:hypothetical protein